MASCKSQEGGTKRRANFTHVEAEALVDAIATNYEKLFGKLSSTLTAVEKERIWDEVVECVTAVGPCVRSKQELKKKYQKLKSDVKAKEAANRREIRKTGGGHAELEELDELSTKILSTMPSIAIEGFADGFDTSGEQNRTQSVSSTAGPSGSSQRIRLESNLREKDDTVEGGSSRKLPKSISSTGKRKKPLESTLYRLQSRQVELLEKQVEATERIAKLLQERNTIETEKLVLKKKKLHETEQDLLC